MTVVDAAAIEERIRAEQDEIRVLCEIANRPDVLGEAVKNRWTLAQTRDHLWAQRSETSQRTAVQSHVQGSPSGAESQLNAAATQIAASRNITFAKAYVEALTQNPKLYQQYLAEKSVPRPA